MAFIFKLAKSILVCFINFLSGKISQWQWDSHWLLPLWICIFWSSNSWRSNGSKLTNLTKYLGVLKNCSLTLQVPMVTNIKFLLTISIHCQEIRLWELLKWSPKRKCLDLLSNSLNTFFNNMYRDQLGEFVYMCILGLKGLKNL